MKKAFKIMAVAAIMVFATSSSLMAQVKFGVKASGSANFMSMDTTMFGKDWEKSPVFGFNVGVMGEFFLNDNMSIGAELLFAQQGFKRSISEDGDEIAVTYRTNHINLPILFRYYIGGLAIEVGPQVSFCFGGKSNVYDKFVAGGQTILDTTYTESLSDAEKDVQKKEGLSDFKLWNRINIGGTIGLSYNMPSGLFFGARYTYDFTNAFNDMKLGDDLKPKQEAIKSHHGVISVSVGFKF